MAPRISVVAAPTSGGISDASVRDRWVNVSWMAHTTLSQTSHVCVSIRSAHIRWDHLWQDEQDDDQDGERMEWKVRVTIHGFAGLDLASDLACQTRASMIHARKGGAIPKQDELETALSDDNAPLRPTVGFATHDFVWDYLIHLPVRWRDLPRDAYLQLDVLDARDVVVYQGTLPFFGPFGKLFTGLQKVQLYHPPLDATKNHGLIPLHPRNSRERSEGMYSESDLSTYDGEGDDDDDDPAWKASCVLYQMERMEESSKLAQKTGTSFGQVPSVPWLDALQRERAISVLAEGSKSSSDRLMLPKSGKPFACLIFELPIFDIPILYEETIYPVPQHGACGAVAPLDLWLYWKQECSGEGTGDQNQFDPLQLVPFLDYENEQDNPVEDKYRTLAHDLLRGLVDPALKPDRSQRDRLAAIIDSPSHHPTREEKDLLWRFRFSLVDNRKALTKFLLTVDWTVDSEVVQAAELLDQWRKRSPIEVTDALKLLGKHVAFQTNLVRSYAIDTLAAAPDSELRLYLLQLVQALKYENLDSNESDSAGAVGTAKKGIGQAGSQVSSLATFLIARAAKNIQLANFLYWYLKVEVENPNHGSRYKEVLEALKRKLSETKFVFPWSQSRHDDISASRPFKSIVDSVSKLGSSFRGDTQTAESDRTQTKHRSKDKSMWEVLVEQDNFISGILDAQQRARDSRGKKDAKEAELKTMLSKEGYDRNAQRLAVPLPSSPEIFVNGVKPDTAKVFKSALYPALIEFHVSGTILADTNHADVSKSQASLGRAEHSEIYRVILKTGDDLRQDQLVIMMFQLMDGLLKRAALDLCLTPYSILATSPTSGLVEFVDNSMPISQILSKYNGSIMQYFQSIAPLKGAKYDIRPDVLSNFIRSMAGYCVITYLLAVGDRHLDNLLLRESGHFFHIDFGFIFGRDPKPLPPAFRLTRELVDGMGGVESTEYRQFGSLACQAFNALRKSAGLILNLLHLMSDAGIEDLSNNPSADSEGVIAKVEERFRLDLTDEQAERYFMGLIGDCLAAIAPRVMDVFHSFSVARR